MDERDWQCRTGLLIGQESLVRLKKSVVLVVGLGGVGSIAAEMICRAGVGSMTLADGDVYSVTNRNRQTEALITTEGLKKVQVLSEKLLKINPEIKLIIRDTYLKGEDMPLLLEFPYDFVVDAIDTLSPKVYLLYHCVKNKLPVVSSMGSGGKLNPALVRVDDISKTSHCNFAYDIRKRLHKLGIFSGITAVYSPETVPPHVKEIKENEMNKKSVTGTISYMPVVFGCYCAYVVISNLTDK